MNRRLLDTAGIGQRGVNIVEEIILSAGHLLEAGNASLDKGIDGYIRLRKRVKSKKVINNKQVSVEDQVETGNIIGIQVKTVTSIPTKKSSSYYIIQKDKTKFGVNFSTAEKLQKNRQIWNNFIGPVILLFVDLETKKVWWADLNNKDIYTENEYSITISKFDEFNNGAFRKIVKLGRETFVKKKLKTIATTNGHFFPLALTNFKKSAKEAYANLSGSGEFFFETHNPVLGQVHYTRSGWKHITRLNRRKMRIFNSILLLGVSRSICETVDRFSSVKKGLLRESNQFIKKVDFLTLRANVDYNFRESSIVQVVLRRVKTFDKLDGTNKIPDKVFFHSVYEPYRKE